MRLRKLPVSRLIPHGAVLALLGPSGCGKTTLLRLIAGFDRIDSGVIAFDDRIVASSDVYLAPDPALILLNEPFNALDLDLRRTMCEDVVAMLRQRETTTVLVTHDPGEAFAVADLVAVMHGGKVMQCARPEQVYWQPQTATVARLTGASIFLRGESHGDEAICPLGRLPVRAA